MVARGPGRKYLAGFRRARAIARRHQTDRGPSQRQLRVGELIRRILSEVLARGDIHDPELQSMSITVGEVAVSPDLKIATAWVLPLGGRDREKAIAALKRNKGELRRALGRETVLKFAPDLRFRIDETYDRMDDTRRLFSDETVRRDLAADGSGDGEGAE